MNDVDFQAGLEPIDNNKLELQFCCQCFRKAKEIKIHEISQVHVSCLFFEQFERPRVNGWKSNVRVKLERSINWETSIFTI